MSKKTGDWVAELSKAFDEELDDKHPGEGWLTKEEVQKELEAGFPGEHFTDYKMRGFLTTLKAKGRVKIAVRYMPIGDGGERRRQVFYKLTK